MAILIPMLNVRRFTVPVLAPTPPLPSDADWMCPFPFTFPFVSSSRVPTIRLSSSLFPLSFPFAFASAVELDRASKLPIRAKLSPSLTLSSVVGPCTRDAPERAERPEAIEVTDAADEERGRRSKRPLSAATALPPLLLPTPLPLESGRTVPGCERAVAEFLEEVEEKENLGEKGLLEEGEEGAGAVATERTEREEGATEGAREAA